MTNFEVKTTTALDLREVQTEKSLIVMIIYNTKTSFTILGPSLHI
jgi:hypothetical protein